MTARPLTAPVCLTYCSLPFSAKGWPLTCTSMIAPFPEAGLAATLVLPRTRAMVPPSITTETALGYPLSRMPWKLVSPLGRKRMQSRFASLLDRADPAHTVAYFWPGTPPDLVRHARSRGILTVREMINTFEGTAKRILDRAYATAGFLPAHGITDADVVAERAELALYDYVSAPSPGVEASLSDAGVDADRVLSGTFGWSPERFGATGHELAETGSGPRFLFVGTIGVRKGIPELLRAWCHHVESGELLLVGPVEPALEALVAGAIAKGRVRHLPFTPEIACHYAKSNAFVFPTHEEGCPQVVMEAAACGLPVITTAMGAGWLVRDGENGLIVPPGNVEVLAMAINRLAKDRDLRRRMAERAQADATRFTYDNIGRQRARVFIELLAQRRSSVL